MTESSISTGVFPASQEFGAAPAKGLRGKSAREDEARDGEAFTGLLSQVGTPRQKADRGTSPDGNSEGPPVSFATSRFVPDRILVEHPIEGMSARMDASGETSIPLGAPSPETDETSPDAPQITMPPAAVWPDDGGKNRHPNMGASVPKMQSRSAPPAAANNIGAIASLLPHAAEDAPLSGEPAPLAASAMGTSSEMKPATDFTLPAARAGGTHKNPAAHARPDVRTDAAQMSGHIPDSEKPHDGKAAAKAAAHGSAFSLPPAISALSSTHKHGVNPPSGHGTAPEPGERLSSMMSLDAAAAQIPDSAKVSRAEAMQAAEARPATRQLAVAVTHAIRAGNEHVRVRLYPEELGQVDLTLKMQDGQLRITIAAERPETLQQLQQNQRALERALSDAGLGQGAAHLEFAGGERGSNGEREQTGAGNRRGPDAARISETAAPLPGARHGDGLIDITL